MSSIDPKTLHAIAFLYLTFTHGTDGSVSGEEMRELARKLGAWEPEASLDTIGSILKQTVADYKSKPTRNDKFAEARIRAEVLKGKMMPNQLSAVLTDMRSLAEVDGEVSPEESEFIVQMAKTLGIHPPI